MEYKNNNKFLVVIFILILIIIGLCSYIAYDKIVHKQTKCPKCICNKCKVTTTNSSNKTEDIFLLGDEVKVSKLSGVDTGYPEKEDFSKFYVLSDDGEYVTLLMHKTLVKAGAYTDITKIKNEFKNLFIKNGVDFGEKGEFRGLNENELQILGCDLYKKDCSNLKPFVNDTLTDPINDTYYYVHKETGSLESVDIQSVQVYYRPVIKILKTNLK